ncbi:MAG: hypothetical protein ACR2L6_08130 [Gemmatimonadaceae bacterium]
MSRALALPLLVGLAMACAPAAAPGRDTQGRATVEVENRSFLDVNVYAVRSGQRIRLGSVTGQSTRTFVIPSTLVGTGALVRFQADFIGSNRAPVSEEMMIWAGDEVELTIPSA